jgi:hypothetical protein
MGCAIHMYCNDYIVTVGATLCQPYGPDLKDCSIIFASYQLTLAEKNYSIMEQKCFGMVFTVKMFRQCHNPS